MFTGFNLTPPQEFTQNQSTANPDEFVCVTHATSDRVHRGRSANRESVGLSYCSNSSPLFRSGDRDVDGCGGI